MAAQAATREIEPNAASRFAVLGDANVQSTLLAEALEHAPVGVLVFDDRGNYVAANKAACELTGYTRPELLAGGASSIIADPDGLGERLAAVAAGTLRSGRATLRRKCGAIREIEYQVGETRAAGVPFWLTVFWAAPSA